MATATRSPIAGRAEIPEAIPEHPPEQWGLVSRRRMTADTHPLDTIALRALNPGGVKFGDLGIGNSWQAVTKPATATTPQEGAGGP